MKIHLPLITLFLFTFLFYSCNHNEVEISSFGPIGEVQDLTTFEISFDKDLAPEDYLGRWVDDAFIEFEPELTGKFKWLASNFLIFSPDVSLKPGVDYEAKVTKKVLFDTKFSTDFDSYDFHTAYFDALQVDFYWTKIAHSDYKLTAKANIYFNYEVDPKELRENLEILQNGNNLDFSIVSTDLANVIAVDLGEQQQQQESQELKFSIAKNMSSPVTNSTLAEERGFDVTIPPITRLTITSVSSGFDGVNGWVEIFTTQEVDDKVLSRYLDLDTEKNVKYTTTENRVRITGDFEPGDMMELIVKKGLPGMYGGTLEHEYKETLLMADLDPSLSFFDRKGKYLMRSGMKNLEVEAINVQQVDVEVYEVFSNNILYFLYNNGGGYYDNYYYDDYYETDYSVGNFGKLIKRDTVQLGNYENTVQKFSVNLESFLNPRFTGIYVVNVRDEQDYWRRASKVVSVSDIGIITKKSQDDLWVFVNSIATTEPMAGVTVSLVSNNNQTLLQGVTDASGILHFEDVSIAEDGFSSRLLIAEKGKDFNFIDLRESRVETSRFDVSGKYESSSTYDTYVYADRNLYRPGETANISAIVRNKNIEIVRDIPVLLKILAPNGRELKTYNKKLNVQGSFEQAVKIPVSSRTGEYVAEVYSGSKELLSSYRFSVEEFVPDKIRVNIDADKKVAELGDALMIKLNAEYLFGAPAAGNDFEFDVRLTHSGFHSKKYKDYNFRNSSISNSYLDNDFVSDALDEKGKGEITYDVPDDITGKGKINGTAYVSVFDATGRTVNRSIGFTIYPNDYYIGIKSPSYYYGVDKQISMNIAAVNGADEDLTNFAAEVEIIRHEWRTVLRKSSSGYWRYESERKEVIEKSKQSITVSGAKTFTFSVKRSGNYEIRVYKKGSKNYVEQNFYCYGWGSSTATSFEVDKEGRVEMVFDKDHYSPGETAKILFTTPFSGKMLVTVEREKVMEHHYLDVQGNSAELNLPITDVHLPNIYITATLFRKHELNSPTPFLVGHGFESVKVDRPEYKLPVEIIAPEKIKPNTTQEIVIKTAPEKDIYVTLAMVDEGILQIKNFQSPDPYAYMYAKRSLSVNSYDLYELLLPEVEGIQAHPAGGDDGGAKRLNPVTAQRFKLLSYWSGIRKSNSSGEVRIKIPVPQFNGEARLMAVAYEGKRFGSGSKPMTITDNVVMMPAIPRFLSVTDSIELPISLMNTTEKGGKVTVKLEVEGLLKISGKNSKSVQIGGKETKVLKFAVVAEKGAGKGKIILTASGLDNVRQEVEIAVRPVSPLVVEDGSGTLRAGQSEKIQIPSGFFAESQNTSLTISKFPAAKFSKHLKYLVGYPYGCVEQTTSKAFPQIYFEDLAAAIAPDAFIAGSPVYFVNEAISKLQSMQRSDGSLSYWQGGSYSSWWGSAFAAHFLVEAKKAGYNVSDYTLNRLLKYLARQAAEKETYSYHRYINNSTKVEVKAKKEIIYSLYVLALADQGDMSLMNYYRSRKHLLSNDAKYLLGGAFALMNEWNAFHELMPGNFVSEKIQRESGGSFDSEVRANAIILNVLLDVDPSNKQIPHLIKYLSDNSSSMYSTQDRCWGFLALGKAAKKNASSNVQVSVEVEGKNLKTYEGHGSLNFSSNEMNGKKITLNGSGTGEVYYFWNTEGIKVNADLDVADVDQNVRVRRQYYDRFGNKINGNTFYQGDLIVCQLNITGGARSVENVAISDLIPAGFEIENPRLTTSTSLNWVNNTMYYDYMDVRDDRLLLFTDVRANKESTFYYMLRVVNAGTFRLAPIGAEAMYDPEYHSYNGAGVVKVIPKPQEGL